MAESILDWYIKNALALAFDSVEIEAAPVDGVANDDAWITVHPNEGTGRHVLLDDDGYIKSGMGGTFKGQRIDLIPRKGNKKPTGNEPIKPAQQRYKLKPPTKPAMPPKPGAKKTAPKKPAAKKAEEKKVTPQKGMAAQPRGSSPEKEALLRNTLNNMSTHRKSEVASSFGSSPGDLVQAISNNCQRTGYTTLTGDKAKAAYCSGNEICIGEKHADYRDKAAKSDWGSSPEFYEVNNHLGTLRHEMGHALDKKLARFYTGEGGRKTTNVKDLVYASSTSEEFHSAVGRTQMALYGEDGKLKSEIVKDFGLEYSLGRDTYSADETASGPKLSKCAPLSDILSALTHGRANGYWCHTTSYWDKGEHFMRTEIFANLTALYGAPTDYGWKEAERVFPELTKAYKSMIERAAKSTA